MPCAGESSYLCFTGAHEYFWGPVKSPHEFSPANLYLAHLSPPDAQEKQEVEENYLNQIEALRQHSEKAITEWKTEYERVCALLKCDGLYSLF